ncbi:MAG: hypothetical protein JW795_07995 [Chitinivibrionales bacterium]|nr:hypothetical protein [Chitinivibrionales bacterium]
MGLNDMGLFHDISKAGIAAIAVLAKPMAPTHMYPLKRSFNSLEGITCFQSGDHHLRIILQG